MEIDGQIKIFLEKNLGGFTGLQSLQGDASDRAYQRVHTGKGTYVLCMDRGLKGNHAGSYPFFIMHRLLNENGLRVPEIYGIDEGSGLILMQDLGDILLEDYLKNLSDEEIRNIYSGIIADLVRLQGISRKKIDYSPPLFDAAKLMQEFNFFIEHALEGYFKASLPDGRKKELQREFQGIAEALDAPDLFVLNHRDFHSRNIMVARGACYYIDFQDARMGLPQYDLVSLLRDSYVRLKDPVYASLKDLYYEQSKDDGVQNMPRDDFDHYFNLMAFQRNIKAVGSFGYLVTVKKKEYFKSYINPAFSYIDDYVNNDESLKKSWEIIRDSARI